VILRPSEEKFPKEKELMVLWTMLPWHQNTRENKGPPVTKKEAEEAIQQHYFCYQKSRRV
jgi:hypothetical protein